MYWRITIAIIRPTSFVGSTATLTFGKPGC